MTPHEYQGERMSYHSVNGYNYLTHKNTYQQK